MLADVDGAESQHYEIPGADFAILAACINQRLARRNLMIKLLARNLQQSAEDDDLHEIFLKTAEEIREEEPLQIPEYRTTLVHKICLRKIFQPQAQYKSDIPSKLKHKVQRFLS